jgi:acyl carrier protein
MTELSEAEVRKKVREFVEREFLYMRPEFALADDDGLMAVGVIDSMGVLEMITFLEDAFQIAVADGEITTANLGSINAIATFVARARAVERTT